MLVGDFPNPCLEQRLTTEVRDDSEGARVLQPGSTKGEKEGNDGDQVVRSDDSKLKEPKFCQESDCLLDGEVAPSGGLASPTQAAGKTDQSQYGSGGLGHCRAVKAHFAQSHEIVVAAMI